MSARISDGWLVVDYSGPELVLIELGTGTASPENYRPAFLDYEGDSRVAKVLLPPSAFSTPTATVWLRVRGTESRVGRITL